VPKPLTLRGPVALAPVQPGDFCCVPISGAVGLGIEIGQFLAGDKFQPYDHAEIFVGQEDEAGPNGYTVSAYPGGYGLRALSAPPQFVEGSLWSSGLIELEDHQRQGIVSWAMRHKNVGYSFLDYLALELHTLHIPVPGLRDFIQASSHLICSQFVDLAFGNGGGVTLFDDKRWAGFVKPGDLAMLLQSRMNPAYLALKARP
jgi:hypothetical protein